jgi:hypothetical protein
VKKKAEPVASQRGDWALDFAQRVSARPDFSAEADGSSSGLWPLNPHSAPNLGQPNEVAAGSPLAGAFRSASKLAAYDELPESGSPPEWPDFEELEEENPGDEVADGGE